ncbi:hypothetical protein [Brevibacillus laterosporus]|uniref:hypothetical protein n=1 Tax=Brevibacillus laterosporus TaxID=1465 RepID=UPI00215880FF|nr:hypothetical protein [Brevibacillus laterosporus]
MSIFSIPVLSKEKNVVHLSGYWANDIWEVKDSFFNEFGAGSNWNYSSKRFNFLFFSSSLGNEIKFFFFTRIVNNLTTLKTISNFAKTFGRLSDFINHNYPKIYSFIDIPYDEGLGQYRAYLKKNNIKSAYYFRFFKSLLKFFYDFYDTRDECDKDVWDFRKIPNARYPLGWSNFILRFDNIPEKFRTMVKDFCRVSIINTGQSHLKNLIRGIKIFIDFYNNNNPNVYDFSQVKREDIEKYLFFFYQRYGNLTVSARNAYLLGLQYFFEFLQNTKRKEAPTVPVYGLIFKEDFPKLRKYNENDIKYIPEAVINQLECLLAKNPTDINPPMTDHDKEYLPIVILLMATGWRISDILNLRHNDCLIKTDNGFYLQGDIPKTNLKQHRVPIEKMWHKLLKVLLSKQKKNQRRKIIPINICS